MAAPAKNIAINKPTFTNGYYYLDNDPQKAVDGDTVTAWNSGCHHPAWLGIDLEGVCSIDSINVKLAQTPAGPTAFQAWAYSGGDSMIAAKWVGHTENGSWLRKGFETPLRNVDKICIFSKISPSWISFYEVAVVGVVLKKKQPANKNCSLPASNSRSLADSNTCFAFDNKNHSFPDSNAGPLADSNACFAFDLYKRLAAQSGNVIFSPYSISIALAMAYGGARSATEKQMAKVLHFADNASVHECFLKIRQSLETVNDEKNRLLIANAIWPQKCYLFLPEYFDLLKTHYGVSVTYLDYVTKTEQARQTINTWVAEQTKGYIIDLIPAGVLSVDTRLVLTNAVYLKAPWALPFDRNSTAERDFNLLSGKPVRTEFMHKEDRFRYAETDKMQVLEMLYSGQQLSMMVLLPRKNDLSAVESELSPVRLRQIVNSLVQWKVRVMVPTFTMDQAFSLSTVLSSMGMPLAFGGNADFSGMDGKKDLFISSIVHKAFIEVSEEGTVAAAATAVNFVLICDEKELEPKEFIADRPFIFLIRDNSTGTILFIGRLTNPKLQL